MELLKKLYEIHSPSRKEKKLKQFIKKYVKSNIPNVIIETDHIGNLYFTKGNATNNYPCVVAHLDQVQRINSKDFKAIETEDIIFGYSPKNRKQEGLGADDKNGVYICLKCLAKYDTIKIALFVQEEVGCIGSSHANLKFFDDCRYVIQPDRKGYKDLITSIGWSALCSQEFIEAIEPHQFGYFETEGMITDVGELKSRGLGISCINVSCGYYSPHTDEEFTVKKDLQNCLAFIQHIIENVTDTYPHVEVEDDTDDYGWYWNENRLEACEELARIIADEIFTDPDVNSNKLFEKYNHLFPEFKKADYENMLDSVNYQYLNY